MVDEKKEYKEYGNWTRTDGKLEEFTENEIDEFKQLIYESATESLQEIGINLADHKVEWIIQQAYYDGNQFVHPEHPLAVPCVTIAWKTKVINNG